jgi:hypothetical protein
VDTRHKFDDSWEILHLLGFDVDRETALPGDLTKFTFMWKSGSYHSAAYSITLRLVSSHETIVAEYVLPPVRDEFPTSMWTVGDIWRGQHIVRLPADLESDLYQWEVSVCPESPSENALPLTPLKVTAPERMWDIPDRHFSTGVIFGNTVELLGVQNALEPLHPGQAFSVTLVWRAEVLMNESYRVFVHLLGPDGGLVAQSDSEPAQWLRPTTGWLPGEVVLDTHILTLPGDAPPGVYHLFTGMYTLEQGRLQTPESVDSAQLGEVIIQGD